MSENTPNTDPTPEPAIKSMNPEALNYLNWFMSDASSLRNWAGQIFSNDMDLNSSKLIELKNAAEISLLELDDDIAKIREFLASYIPPNNN